METEPQTEDPDGAPTTEPEQAPEIAEVKLVEPENPLPETTLADLSASQREAVAKAGWPSLAPVQARAIPYLAAERDLIIQSRTGSCALRAARSSRDTGLAWTGSPARKRARSRARAWAEG